MVEHIPPQECRREVSQERKKSRALMCGQELPYLHTYLLTYLLTAWSRVLEKLTGRQLVEKFPAFYGTRRFITALQVPASCPNHERNYLALLVILSAGLALVQAVYFCTKQSDVGEYSDGLGISVCLNAFEFERLCVEQ